MLPHTLDEKNNINIHWQDTQKSRVLPNYSTQDDNHKRLPRRVVTTALT